MLNCIVNNPYSSILPVSNGKNNSSLFLVACFRYAIAQQTIYILEEWRKIFLHNRLNALTQIENYRYLCKGIIIFLRKG